MKYIFQPLMDDGSLIKIQDETGKALEDYGVFGGWVNNIGNIALTEGYKIKVNRDCMLSYTGTPAFMPFQIPLKAGWNIMGYPQITEADGKAVVQQLISRGTLIKVQDEAGRSIEDFGVFGGWKNNIGNFKPGEGYKVKVTANEMLTIYPSYPKSAAVPETAGVPLHFQPVVKGNGVDHMNINLVNIPVGFAEPGDEIAVFDGNLCVGGVAISNPQSTIRHPPSSIRHLSIPVTANDGAGEPGFTGGNLFTLKLWKASEDKEYLLEPEIIKGTPAFQKHESTFASLEKYATTGMRDKMIPGEMRIRIYPNPSHGKVFISPGILSPEGIQVQVINSSGQIIVDKYIETDPGVVDLSGNVEGIYYIRMTTDYGTKTEKVVLRK